MREILGIHIRFTVLLYRASDTPHVVTDRMAVTPGRCKGCLNTKMTSESSLLKVRLHLFDLVSMPNGEVIPHCGVRVETSMGFSTSAFTTVAVPNVSMVVPTLRSIYEA